MDFVPIFDELGGDVGSFVGGYGAGDSDDDAGHGWVLVIFLFRQLGGLTF